MRGIFDYLMEDYYDADRFDSVRDYFYRRYMATSGDCEDYIDDEAVKSDAQSKGKKKPISRSGASQDNYDASIEQERKEARDLERHIHRRAIFGRYIPNGMERDF